jgi:hypothetical protein
MQQAIYMNRLKIFEPMLFIARKVGVGVLDIRSRPHSARVIPFQNLYWINKELLIHQQTMANFLFDNFLFRIQNYEDVVVNGTRSRDRSVNGCQRLPAPRDATPETWI